MILTLSHHERNRLMRSTRKLGAVLGTIPSLEVEHYEDASSAPSTSTLAPPMERRLRPKVSMTLKPAAPASTSPSVPSPSNSFYPHDRPVLHVRSFGRRDRADSVDSVCSVATLATTPLSPTFHQHSNSDPGPASAAFRRQKMAKLTRTLGENIPHELIFNAGNTALHAPPARRSLSSKQDKARRRRSGSLSLEAMIESVAQSTVAAKPSAVYNITKPVLALDIWDEELDMAITGKSPVAEVDPLSPLTRSSSASRLRTRRGRVNSEVRHVRSQTDLKSSPIEEDEPESEHASSDVTHRRDGLWSGEWNRKDMDTVLRDLRNLR